MTLIEALKHEVEIRTDEYRRILGYIIERAHEANRRPVSTHTGHNIGAQANELSVAAAKVEAAQAALLFEEQNGGAQ